MQSVAITTQVVSLARDHGEVYSIQPALCDNICQGHVAGRWFSPGTPVSSTNRTDRHDINICKSGVKHHTPNSISF
jgi:hypothetical protein